MTLRIELPEEQRAALEAKATARGVSAETYVQELLTRHLKGSELPEKRISDVFREIWGDMPNEDRATLPADGADQIDHYVYGVPKRSQ